MTSTETIIAAATLTGALSMWLMLPRGFAPGRLVGTLLGLVSLGLFAALLWPLGGWGSNALFWSVAGVTLVAAAAGVTFRNPVYCAVWFALSLLGTAGLFLIQGAQFLAVATIVVYAGAILVTFLFVLMLAQSRGKAFYDRISWEPLLAAATGAVLVGILTMALGSAALQNEPVVKPTALQADILSSEHVAHLGGELFSRYLIAVELAGTLLLVALVGAIAIVGHQKIVDIQNAEPSRRPSSDGPSSRRPAASAALPKDSAHG